MEDCLIYTLNNKEYYLIDELTDENRNFMYLMAVDKSKTLIVEKVIDNENIIIKSISDDDLFNKITLLFAKKAKEEINC